MARTTPCPPAASQTVSDRPPAATPAWPRSVFAYRTVYRPLSLRSQARPPERPGRTPDPAGRVTGPSPGRPSFSTRSATSPSTPSPSARGDAFAGRGDAGAHPTASRRSRRLQERRVGTAVSPPAGRPTAAGSSAIGHLSPPGERRLRRDGRSRTSAVQRPPVWSHAVGGRAVRPQVRHRFCVRFDAGVAGRPGRRRPLTSPFHPLRSPLWISPRQPLPGGACRHRAAYADVPRRGPNGAGSLRWWRCWRARRFS